MAIRINRSDPSSSITLHLQLPDISNSEDLELVFESQYDKTRFMATIASVSRGDFRYSTIDATDVPTYTGSYTLEVHNTVADFLSLDQLTISLDQLEASLDNIRGDNYSLLIYQTLAQIIGTDFETPITYSITDGDFNEYMTSTGDANEYRGDNEDGRSNTYIS